MNSTRKEIIRTTSLIISISLKLIVWVLVILLLYEGITRGYAFGYSLFSNKTMEAAPGRDMRVTIGEDESILNLAAALERSGLVEDQFSFVIQCIFYEYGYEFMDYGKPVRSGTFVLNTSMTPKEIIITLRDGSGKIETEESDAGE